MVSLLLFLLNILVANALPVPAVLKLRESDNAVSISDIATFDWSVINQGKAAVQGELTVS